MTEMSEFDPSGIESYIRQQIEDDPGLLIKIMPIDRFLDLGVAAAAREEWDYIDKNIVNVFDQALKEEFNLRIDSKDLINIIGTYALNPDPRVQDYAASIALPLIKNEPRFDYHELSLNLKNIAYGVCPETGDSAKLQDDKFWAAFRASIALLELDMQLLKIHPERTGDLRYRNLIANLRDGLEKDSDHEELVAPYIAHAWDVYNKLKGNIALIQDPDAEIPKEDK